MIKRLLESILQERLTKNKVLVIYGARQVGKSSLLHSIFDDRNDVMWLNGDEPQVQNLFDGVTVARIKALIGDKKVLVVDEAQNVLNIGTQLKIIHDNIPEILLVATGSSSFDLANKVNEPLTGRKYEFRLFPLSFEEMAAENGLFGERNLLKHRLVYGCYPEIVCDIEDERELLNNLATSYLYKDILLWENIKRSERIGKLLQAIALQLGSQVSFTELGSLCGLDNKTIEKYIALLEQAFIIFRLPSFARNLRNELKFSRKIYFFDNGIRNALIGNYNPVELRTDVGALWENFAVSERMKFNEYHRTYASSWFWRTTSQTEIDYIEEKDGHLDAYEFKWNSRRKVSVPPTFAKAYPTAGFKVITPENIDEFLLPSHSV